MHYKNCFLIAWISLMVFGISCKTDKPPTTPLVSEATTANKHIIQKRLFYDSFPLPTGYVNDYEGVFTTAEKNTLESIITAFEKETSIEITLITFDSSMTTGNGLDALTLRIANEWGAGKRNKNNGIVTGLSKHFRKMRIENGAGIQKILSDAETKKIIDEDFLPLFKQGNYFEGAKTGLLSLMRKLRGKYTA